MCRTDPMATVTLCMRAPMPEGYQLAPDAVIHADHVPVTRGGHTVGRVIGMYVRDGDLYVTMEVHRSTVATT